MKETDKNTIGSLPCLHQDNCPRQYIDILFQYDDDIYSERIYLDMIDTNHYDDLWDYWFGCGAEDKHPNIVFEVTADKDNDGKFTLSNLYINVYVTENDDKPISVITAFSYRKSWCNHKAYK